MTEIRREMVTAVTWKIVAELFRRHHAGAGLLIYETHPGGGQYDCLSLYSGQTHLCDFNRQSSHLHIWGKVGPPAKILSELRWPDENDYVMAYLQCAEPKIVIDRIESLLGLRPAKSPLPPTTAPVLAVRLISEILVRFAFERFGLDVRNALFDTSGMGLSRIRDELRSIPAIASQIPPAPENSDRFAARFWLLRSQSEHSGMQCRAIVDMRGIVYPAQPPHQEIRVFEEYRASHLIHPLAEKVAAICRSGK